MKKIMLFIAILFGVVSCLESESPEIQEPTIKELQINQSTSGTIMPENDVDWYHISAVEANSVLNIKCTGNITNPQVALSATVYEEEEGTIGRRLIGAQAPDDAYRPANIEMNIPVTTPTGFYVAVRDYMDDDSSEKYQYSLVASFYENNETGDNFAEATEIMVDDSGTCQTEAIDTVGDADCFSFQVDSAGVYEVNIGFEPLTGSPVHPGFDMYDEEGNTVESLQTAQLSTYNMVHYLRAGTYYVVVDDQGRDDADPSSPYTICVSSINVQEVMGNDNATTADEMDEVVGALTPTFQMQGALAYMNDADWYRLNLADPEPGLFRVLRFIFDDDQEQIGNFNYLLEVRDEDETVILAHDFRTGSPVFVSQILAGTGDYYITVSGVDGQPFSNIRQYTVTAEVMEVSDPAEIQGNGNDDITTAEVLTSGSSVSGKIGYRGDADWYTIDVLADTGSPQILELFFDTQESSLVDYCVNIMVGDELKQISDKYGADGPTHLKTSLYVTSNSTYFFKVIDCQADDGDDVQYSFSANVIPETASNPAPKDGQTTFYYSETYERTMVEADYTDVELEIYSQYQPHFKTNTTLLQVDSLDSNNQWTSDWIAGYIDYQSDQDFFKLDIAPMGTDTQWYYDIAVTLYSPGSDVEYTWKLYRDRANDNNPPNGIVIERTPGTDGNPNFEDRDGVMAAYADPNISVQLLDTTIPDAGQPFWIGDGWGDDWFYLGISDFNYINLEDNGGAVSLNPLPDDDWGYDAPYYFKVMLTYYPGISNP